MLLTLECLPCQALELTIRSERQIGVGHFGDQGQLRAAGVPPPAPTYCSRAACVRLRTRAEQIHFVGGDGQIGVEVAARPVWEYRRLKMAGIFWRVKLPWASIEGSRAARCIRY